MITTLPASKGGDLVTSLPQDQVGLANWVGRLNWRHEDGQEVTREGDVIFNRADPIDLREPITGVFHARHPNGTPVIFLCTPSAIYRFLGSLELGRSAEVEDFGVYGRSKYGPRSEYYPIYGEWADVYLTANTTEDDTITLRAAGDLPTRTASSTAQLKIYHLQGPGSVDYDKAPRYKVGLSVHQYSKGLGRSVGVVSLTHAAPRSTLTGGNLTLDLSFAGRSDTDIYTELGTEDWAVTTLATSTTSELHLPGDWAEFVNRRVDVRIGNSNLSNAVVESYDVTNNRTPVVGGTWSSPLTAPDTQTAQVSKIRFHLTTVPFQTEPNDLSELVALFPDATDLGGGWYEDPDFGVVYLTYFVDDRNRGGYLWTDGVFLRVYGAPADGALGFYEDSLGVWFVSYRGDNEVTGATVSFKGHIARTASDTGDWYWFTGTASEIVAGTETRLPSGILVGADAVYSAERMVHSITGSGPYALKLWGDWTFALQNPNSTTVQISLLTSKQTIVVVDAEVVGASHAEPLEEFGWVTEFNFNTADIVSGIGDIADVDENSVVSSVEKLNGDSSGFVADTGLPVYETRHNFTYARINPSEDPSNPSGGQYLFGVGWDPDRTPLRWQMVDIDGYAVFNNGYDLPFVYDLSDTSNYRGHLIYELRENGYAFCDTMSVLGGVLTFHDVAELIDTQAQLLRGNSTYHRSKPLGYNLTDGHGAYGPVRNDADPSAYARIRFQIIGSPFNQPERWGAAVSATFTSGDATITTPYRMLSWEVNTSKNLKVVGAGDPTTQAPLYANGNGYEVGDLVRHTGGNLWVALNAGQSDKPNPDDPDNAVQFKNLGPLPAYNLTTGIDSGPTWNGSLWEWEMDAQAGASGTALAYNPDVDAMAPQPFAYKLQGDSSPIINAAELQDRLVIFKANSIYAARLTNDASDPLAFERLYYGNESLFWKWTLVSVEGDFLVYAGREKFYKVDLVRGTPQELPKLSLCDNLFFDYTSADEAENIFAAVNAPTSEVWISVPGSNKTLCWSWLWDRCSLVDFAPTAANTIEVDYERVTPTYLFLYSRYDMAVEEHEGVFVYGRASHPVKLFGNETYVTTRGGAFVEDPETEQFNNPEKTNLPNELISGVGLGVTSSSALERNDPYRDYHAAQLFAHQVVLSKHTDKSPNAEIKVSLRGFNNPAEDVGVNLLPDAAGEVEGGFITIPTAQVDNNTPVHALSQGFQDVIKVDTGRFVAISKRIFDIQTTASRSASRTQED